MSYKSILEELVPILKFLDLIDNDLASRVSMLQLYQKVSFRIHTAVVRIIIYMNCVAEHILSLYQMVYRLEHFLYRRIKLSVDFLGDLCLHLDDSLHLLVEDSKSDILKVGDDLDLVFKENFLSYNMDQ